MAFSESPVTVRAMLPYLGPLIEGRETQWRVADGAARWFAYRIREALFAARANPTLFPELATANFRIEVIGRDEVRAIAKGYPQVEIVADEVPAPALMQTEAQTVEQIAQEWLRQGRTAEKLYFPNADLSQSDLLLLHEWAQQHAVMFFENAGAVTLLPYDEATAEYAWSPEDLWFGDADA